MKKANSISAWVLWVVIALCIANLLAFAAVSYFKYNNVYFHGKTDASSMLGNAVALTFDDGPKEPYTSQILDILRKENVSATFFILGENAVKEPQIVRRISEEGHELGVHAYTHKSLLLQGKNTSIQQISVTKTLLEAIAGNSGRDRERAGGEAGNGKKIKLFRPPYGVFSPVTVSHSKKLNLSLVLWSINSRDYKEKDKDAIIRNVLENANLKPGAIILLHVNSELSVDALSGIISGLKEKGFTFAKVSEII
ncbi:MAG: polysaccharide deacetylase family protein [Candidatus Woesearchaeota archaeon]